MQAGKFCVGKLKLTALGDAHNAGSKNLRPFPSIEGKADISHNSKR